MVVWGRINLKTYLHKNWMLTKLHLVNPFFFLTSVIYKKMKSTFWQLFIMQIILNKDSNLVILSVKKSDTSL